MLIFLKNGRTTRNKNKYICYYNTNNYWYHFYLGTLLMFSLYSRVNNIIWWHTFESILYHGILLIHQSILFTMIPHNMYGLIGSLFSAIYLLVAIINAGLDDTLSSLFTPYAKSKQLFWKFIGIQALINYGISISIIIIMYIFWHTTISSLNIPIIIIVSIVVLESIKKIAKTLLQLSFQFGVTVFGELSTVISYVGSVWIGYACGYPINLYLIFIPLLIVLFCETIVFLYYTYRWYQTLSSNPHQTIMIDDYKRIIKNRTYTFLHQIHHIFFSGNFLVLLSARLFGLDYAGIIKFSSGIALNITIILKKIFGTSSNILLANVKNKDITTQKNCFSLITNKMYQVLFALSLFFVINHKFLLQGNNPTQNIAACLFFLIIFIENFFTTYEQFYIIQERTGYMIIINGLTILLLYGVYTYAILFPPHLILASIFLIRFFSFILTGTLSFFLWRLKPTFTIRPIYFVGSLVISLIFWLTYH